MSQSPNKYKQFKQVDSEGFMAILCPDCNRTFGLKAQELEKVGESSYLVPYSCPYCGVEYTVRND